MARRDSFDYVIVGAGSAGCVIAHRLSERASVLVLDAGVSDEDSPHAQDIRDPRGIARVIHRQSLICRPYVTETQAGLDDRRLAIHRGIVLGGCSSINGLVYVRGNRRDYDEWARLGNAGWGFEELLPAFKRSENFSGGASDYHGAGGPLDVRPLPDPSPASLAFIQAAAGLGFPRSSPQWDFNGAQQEDAAGLYQLTISPGFRRASAASAFLRPAEARSTLTIRTGAAVSGVVVQNGRACGVRVIEAGVERSYRADREVILCAGTFESPRILMLSGIGPADELRAHGIEPLLDLPGVGQNLHDHLQVQVYYAALPAAGSCGFIGEAGLFTHSTTRPAGGSPDLQYHFLAGNPDLVLNPDETPHFIFCPVLARPLSRGAVRLRSSDALAPPVVEPNYLQRAEDAEVLLRGLEIANALAGAAPLAGLRAGGAPFGIADPARPSIRMESGRSRAQRLAFIRSTAKSVWHPVGTCKMGSDRMAVVDPALRVHGVAALRVADASIMPVITSGNTNAPAMMIGERCAEFVLAGS